MHQEVKESRGMNLPYIVFTLFAVLIRVSNEGITERNCSSYEELDSPVKEKGKIIMPSRTALLRSFSI
jgi:hypothetical protein